MAVRNYSMGQLNPVVYFENVKGLISLPPSTEIALQIRDRMRHRGYEMKEARNLTEIDALQQKMERFEYENGQRDLEREENSVAAGRKRVRDRLVSRMVSSSCTPYEREFIQNYLQLREEKRAQYRSRFMNDNCYFESREFDQGHHMLDQVDKIPDSAETECVKCHQARRVTGLTICMKCHTEVLRQIS